MAQNPWLSLPDKAPYVLDSDVQQIRDHNSRADPAYEFDGQLLPEPYFGALEAPVLLLTLNPGRSVLDYQVHSDPEFRRKAQASLVHELSPYPFLHLSPDASTPGALWWRAKTRFLVDAVGSFDTVAKSLLCCQFFPYHSQRFRAASLKLPSQSYTFEIVRAAMDRGAYVVVMRAWRLWSNAIPALHGYPRLFKVSSYANPALSSKNLGPAFNVLSRRLAQCA